MSFCPRGMTGARGEVVECLLPDTSVIRSPHGVLSNAKMRNMKEEANEAARYEKSRAEHGNMTITKIKMVSDSCKPRDA